MTITVYRRIHTPTVHAVRWYPPPDERHAPIKGVERGPREDQQWGFALGMPDGACASWCRLSPGDYVLVSDEGEACAVYGADWFEREYEPVVPSKPARDLAHDYAANPAAAWNQRRMSKHEQRVAVEAAYLAGFRAKGAST